MSYIMDVSSCLREWVSAKGNLALQVTYMRPSQGAEVSISAKTGTAEVTMWPQGTTVTRNSKQCCRLCTNKNPHSIGVMVPKRRLKKVV